MNTPTTRQQILQILESKGSASAAEISRFLHVTPADIRRHLALLQRQGLIVPAGVAPRRGRGRPSRRFQLAQPALPNNLPRLSHALLEALRARLEPAEFESALKQAAEALRAAQPPEPASAPGAASPSQKLAHAVQLLNQMHYKAHWEAHKAGPRLIFNRCPYAAIIQDHPELCVLDQRLLEGLLGFPVELIARLAPDLQGVLHCIFQGRA